MIPAVRHEGIDWLSTSTRDRADPQLADRVLGRLAEIPGVAARIDRLRSRRSRSTLDVLESAAHGIADTVSLMLSRVRQLLRRFEGEIEEATTPAVPSGNATLRCDAAMVSSPPLVEESVPSSPDVRMDSDSDESVPAIFCPACGLRSLAPSGSR